jgi:two-component system response regulator RegA
MIEANINSATEPRRSEPLPLAGLQPSHEAVDGMQPHPAPEALPLLLVDDEASARTRLCRFLTAKGFEVTSVDGTRAALAAATQIPFAYAVVESRLGRDSGLELIKQLRERHPSMRIVVATGFDSFASVILALRAGAVDYLAKPVRGPELVNALLGRTATLPPVPQTQLGLDRVRWEHIQRAFEQCGRNVSGTARVLSMHRRTLQRILAKRAPRPWRHLG